MALIEIRNVYKIFGTGRAGETALDLARAGVEKNDVLAETGCTLGLKDVSLSVERGEIFVVMGLSGSGKSTLIRHINRLIDPTTGKILVDERDVLELSPEELLAFRRGVASMVFQRFALFPHMTVIENVGYGLEVQGVAHEERRRRAMRWIEDVGLIGYENAYPAQLSGGMQQRVGLARALCTDPEILLMDEPFSALDPLIRKQMQEHLIVLQRNLKKTIVFITHDLDEALKLGDRRRDLERRRGRPDRRAGGDSAEPGHRLRARVRARREARARGDGGLHHDAAGRRLDRADRFARHRASGHAAQVHRKRMRRCGWWTQRAPSSAPSRARPSCAAWRIIPGRGRTAAFGLGISILRLRIGIPPYLRPFLVRLNNPGMTGDPSTIEPGIFDRGGVRPFSRIRFDGVLLNAPIKSGNSSI